MNHMQNIFIRNGFVQIPIVSSATGNNSTAIATILMNLEYYGFGVSSDAYRVLSGLSSDSLGVWWVHLEKDLKKVTGADREIDKFVVYKNFPEEVLNKTEAEYWIPQILMYWGFPTALFTQPENPRPDMDPKERKSKTLMLSNENTASFILKGLLGSKEKWKDWQFNDVLKLSEVYSIDFGAIPFKENLVQLAKYFIQAGTSISVKTATDVLRLAAGLSDGDISLRTKVKFKSFDRKTRRFFMNLLAGCKNLEEDVARRKNVWKKFLHNIHPGEFSKSHAKVVVLADSLYKDSLETFNAKVEKGIVEKDTAVLNLLATRPGEFYRRLNHILDVFGETGANAFISILPKLSVLQLVSIRRLLEFSGLRTNRAFPPKGNWEKLQIGKARPVDITLSKKICEAIGPELQKRVPHISVLDSETQRIKLPNGADTGVYSRGTVVKIPEDICFIRTASYWGAKGCRSNIWFDNGWNFFGPNWEQKGCICWNHPKYSIGGEVGAIFSGDPCSSQTADGRATQIIDLYLDELQKAGIKYAVWNILCYSGVPFSKAEDVFAALQWGIDPKAGKLFEPSRAQLSFPIKGDYKTKYICMIDVETREMVYLDVNLKATVQSANANGETLAKEMPVFLEYLSILPTVHDLFRENVSEDGQGQVLYSSENVEMKLEQPAYVFQHTGKQDYIPMDLNKILEM